MRLGIKACRAFWVILLATLIFQADLLFSDSVSPQEHQTIREEVDVVNVRLPVRVFLKKKPVKNLKKSDFKLLVDGKETAVNAFYEVRKTLKATKEIRRPRLFLLIFNISAATGDLIGGMDTFFQRVIRPGDRLMVLTNNMYLKERVVTDPEAELTKVKKILDIETRRIQHKMLSIEFQLRYLASNLIFEMKEGGKFRDPESPINRFIREYSEYFKEFKAVCFNPPQPLYVKVADYLSRQNVDKWVLHFYQIPMFPQLKMSGGTIYTYIDNYFRSRRKQNPYTTFVQTRMTMPADMDFVGQVGKVFLNSGAAFHTQLIKSLPAKYFQEYDYRPVTTDSEHIFREVTNKTNGKVISTNNMNRFVKGISAQEDVVYMLSYAPPPGGKNGGKTGGKARVKLVNKKLRKARLVYDNQHRAGYIKKIAKKINREIPQIRIRRAEVKDGLLHIFIDGIYLPKAPGKEGKAGMLVLNLKVLNESALLITSAQKAFKASAAGVPVTLSLPGLNKGNFQLILEVGDVNSGKNDLEILDFSNPRKIVPAEGMEPFQFVKMTAPGTARTDEGVEEEVGLEPIATVDGFSQTGVSPDNSVDQRVLPAVLKQVAEYCKRLEAASLNFFCSEDIVEKRSNTVQQRGKILKRKNITKNTYSYGYQLIRDRKNVREKRTLFNMNGWKRVVEDAELKTRFKYRNIVYGPSIFNRRSQPYYQYRVTGKRRWNDINVLIIEAVPNSLEDRRFAAGRLYVDETDYSIVRIEILQQSIKNFEDIEKLAQKHSLQPNITIINEYGIQKNGIRFPSKVYYEEAYKTDKGRIVVQSQVNVIFSDYQFYKIDTDVSY